MICFTKRAARTSTPLLLLAGAAVAQLLFTTLIEDISTDGQVVVAVNAGNRGASERARRLERERADQSAKIAQAMLTGDDDGFKAQLEAYANPARNDGQRGAGSALLMERMRAKSSVAEDSHYTPIVFSPVRGGSRARQDRVEARGRRVYDNRVEAQSPQQAGLGSHVITETVDLSDPFPSPPGYPSPPPSPPEASFPLPPSRPVISRRPRPFMRADPAGVSSMHRISGQLHDENRRKMDQKNRKAAGWGDDDDGDPNDPKTAAARLAARSRRNRRIGGLFLLGVVAVIGAFVVVFMALSSSGASGVDALQTLT